MRMPKAARVAFGGEMRFVPSMAQVHLLSPSGSFLRERPLQKHVPTVGPPRRALAGTPPLQPAVSPISNSNP